MRSDAVTAGGPVLVSALKDSGRRFWDRHAQMLIVAVALCGLLLTFGMGSAQAVDSCSPPVCITFQTPEGFLTEAFGASPYEQKVLSGGAAGAQLYGNVGRLRYWTNGTRTAWIFDDVGKEGYQPTTSAFAVENGQIVAARVLYYRESRGEQVGEAYFLQQLMGAPGGRVDNIAGATYSVDMMKRMARTAIALDAAARR